jgi:hypothetical protein
MVMGRPPLRGMVYVLRCGILKWIRGLEKDRSPENRRMQEEEKGGSTVALVGDEPG